MTPIEQLNRVADALDDSIRQGAEIDVPEGARFIILSETLAKLMAFEIRDAIYCFSISDAGESHEPEH